MGLIKAGLGALGGTLADQWKEFFYCEAIPSEVLVTKGVKRTGGRSSNTKGTDNIISQGSVIAVADGQCMIIVEQGKVVELCAEPGEFTYDNSTAPTIFSGKLSESIPAVFKDIGKRFTFGGEPPKDQRVYYFNTKEILGNKYGTASPIPFRVVDNRIGLDLDAQIRCSGTYTYRITNPILFYANVCGNVSTEFTRNTDEFDRTLKDAVVSNLRGALARISAVGIRYSELPAHEKDLRDALNEELSAEWRDLRGIEVITFTMPNAQITEDYLEIIKTKQTDAVLMNTNMAAATLVGAQADAMKSAAKNEGGAMMGFMGMNMAQQTGGMNAQSLYQMNPQQQPQQQAPAAAPGGWTCSCGTAGNTGKFCAECAKPKPEPAGTWTCSCGTAGNTGKFCAECAKPKPADDSWTCSCGTVNKGKFCAECAKPKPADNQPAKCSKCGWESEDPAKPPKFCPECANPF